MNKDKRKKKELLLFSILFWTILLVISIVEYNALDYGFNSPLMLVFWLASMFTITSWIICKNLPAGAKKHRKRWFIPSNNNVDASKIRNEIKKQNQQAVKIAVIWAIFLLFEGLFIHFNIVDQRFIILGMLILRIADRLFVLIWCPFGAIMKNKCCNECRIYGWDQFMLNSPLVFYPSIYTYTLLILSIIPFIEWEISVKRHPERFTQISNAAIRCPNCHEVCGRCRNK